MHRVGLELPILSSAFSFPALNAEGVPKIHTCSKMGIKSCRYNNDECMGRSGVSTFITPKLAWASPPFLKMCPGAFNGQVDGCSSAEAAQQKVRHLIQVHNLLILSKLGIHCAFGLLNSRFST